MAKHVKTARGTTLDFDLLKIKEQIGTKPAPMEVKSRQSFIENRLKRKVKSASVVKSEINIEVDLPSPEIEEVVVLEEKKDDETLSKKPSKQKARPRKVEE